MCCGMDEVICMICRGKVCIRPPTSPTVKHIVIQFGDTHKYCKVLMCLEELNIPCVTPTQT